jgi:hypothetical protein
LLAHGRWFSPASSTTKTGHHDIAKILLKVALNTKNQEKNPLHLVIIEPLRSITITVSLSSVSHHDENRSSVPRPVTFCSDQYIFQFLFRYKCIFIEINSRIWFGPVNSNFHFEDCQLIERRFTMRGVPGSNPTGDIAFFEDKICSIL